MDESEQIFESEKVLELLREIESNPDITQRYLAKKYNTSLGKINYLLNSLLRLGVIKINRFKNSENKIDYAYLLTPKGVVKRLEMAQKFLVRKTLEYELLKKEIAMFSTSSHAESGGEK
jgi:MarR family transcriptional regulator, temperature-dependent positive regulator of motility